MQRILVVLVCVALLNGCTAARVNPGAVPNPRDPQDGRGTVLLAEYVQGLPLGTMVKVERAVGSTVTGTLMKATDQFIVIQRRTRLPEPAEQIALHQVLRVTPESRNGVARAIGIGAAAGAAAALGVFLAILAIYAD